MLSKCLIFEIAVVKDQRKAGSVANVKRFLEPVTVHRQFQRLLVFSALLDQQIKFSFFLFLCEFTQKSVIVCDHFIEKNFTLSAVASSVDTKLHDLGDDRVTLDLKLIKHRTPVLIKR